MVTQFMFRKALVYQKVQLQILSEKYLLMEHVHAEYFDPRKNKLVDQDRFLLISCIA